MVVKDHVDTSVVMNEMIRRSEDSMRRIRYLEELVRSMDLKFESMESSILAKENESIEIIKEQNRNIDSLSKKFLKMDNEISNIKKALSKYAKRADIVGLESYMEMINPMKTDFVTRAEVMEMIRGE